MFKIILVYLSPIKVKGQNGIYMSSGGYKERNGSKGSPFFVGSLLIFFQNWVKMSYL